MGYLGALQKQKKVPLSIWAFPVIVCLFLVVTLCIGLQTTASPYQMKVTIAAVSILSLWCVGLFFSQRKLCLGKQKGYGGIQGSWPILILIMMLVAYFMLTTVWSLGYLSLAPIERINNGTQFEDTLLHTSIAESFTRGLPLRKLVNDEPFHQYHVFSHFLISVVERVLNLPAFFVYNYLYPVLFFPFYIAAIFFAVVSAKKYFTGREGVSTPDIFIVAFFIIGALPRKILAGSAIWKSSYIISESYLIANTLAFLFYGIAFRMLLKKSWKKWQYRLFVLAIIPLFLFLTAGAKISVGCLLTGTVGYYFFRTKMKKIRYWLLNLYYAAVFGGAYLLFHAPTPVVAKSGESTVFDFSKYCTQYLKYPGHFLILASFAIIYLAWEIKKGKITWQNLKSGKTVWTELLIVVTLVAFVPATLMSIWGASAAYFSYFVQTPALILLCGSGCLDSFVQSSALGKKRYTALMTLLVLWCGYLTYTNSLEFPTAQITGEHKSDLYTQLMEVRALAGDRPQEYTIYLDSDIQQNVFVFPALTRIGVINATYLRDSTYYTFQDVVDINNGLTGVTHDKLSLRAAKRRAAQLGKKKLVHISVDEYKVIDLQ